MGLEFADVMRRGFVLLGVGVELSPLLLERKSDEADGLAEFLLVETEVDLGLRVVEVFVVAVLE